jgi:hypothetical protein
MGTSAESKAMPEHHRRLSRSESLFPQVISGQIATFGVSDFAPRFFGCRVDFGFRASDF